MILLTKEEMGLLEWESGTLDMSFMDDYQNEVNALLRAQLKKVMERIRKQSWLSFNSYHDKIRVMWNEEWEAILKEVEDELC